MCGCLKTSANSALASREFAGETLGFTPDSSVCLATWLFWCISLSKSKFPFLLLPYRKGTKPRNSLLEAVAKVGGVEGRLLLFCGNTTNSSWNITNCINSIYLYSSDFIFFFLWSFFSIKFHDGVVMGGSHLYQKSWGKYFFTHVSKQEVCWFKSTSP